MPTFELSDQSGTYHVDAPDETAALNAFHQMNGGGAPEPHTTAGGLLKSAASGVAHGFIDVAGLPADLAHTLYGNKGDANPLGGEALNARADKYLYQPQTGPERFTSNVARYAPAMIGGPESLGTKFATRMLGPAIGSEVAQKALDGTTAAPYAPLIGAIGGSIGAAGALRGYDALQAARAARKPLVTPEQALETGGKQFEAAKDLNVSVKPEFAQNLSQGAKEVLNEFDKDHPGMGPLFNAANRIDELIPKAPEEPILATPPKPTAPVSPQAVQSTPNAPSLNEFLASKGGLGPDTELSAIGAHNHTVDVSGVGRRKLVKQGGMPLDYAREAAQEAGYLHETSTPRDLLDAIDAEMRGNKLYPQGFEGSQNAREATAAAEREAHDLAAHRAGLESDLAAAGHDQLGPEVKQRAMDLMSRGMDADSAVENALRQLEHEDAFKTSDFPGNWELGASPGERAAAAGPQEVKMNEIEKIRKLISQQRMSTDPTVRLAARRLHDLITKAQEGLTPEMGVSGDIGKYIETQKNAIGNWGAGKRGQIISGKRDLAELNAATSGSGANGYNTTAQAFKSLARPINNTNKPTWTKYGFNAKEGAGIEGIAKGTPFRNTMRWLGKAAPTGIVSTAGTLGIGHLAGGVAGEIALPAAGYIAKKIGELSQKKAVQALESLVMSRSPLAQEVAKQLPPRIVRQISLPHKKLLGIAAGVGRGVQKLNNQPSDAVS